MAGTRRSQKMRLARMDAAVEYMARCGFPEGEVKKHVKRLLKDGITTSRMIIVAIDCQHLDGQDYHSGHKFINLVYGGDDGWGFIEDSGYMELWESLLRKEEGSDEGKVAGDAIIRIKEEKLCYGWIGDYEVGKDNFVQFKHAYADFDDPEPEQEHEKTGTGSKGKRSRWDMGPDDS